MNIVEVTNLSKSYGTRQAIDKISFNVKAGSFFSFLGTNGAGKSTTINILTTLIQKDNGYVNIGGYDLGKADEQIREIIGCVFQQGLLDKKLTVMENLKIRGSFYKFSNENLKKRIGELSELIQITDFLNRPYGKLSGGQQRRADIVRALINYPKILFLDEPTAGLDPLSRKILWKTIQNLQYELGMTVFLTTHYMEEADNSDKIIIIDQGRILASGTPNELKEEYSQTMIKLYGVKAPFVSDLKGRGFQPSFSDNCVKIYVKSNHNVLSFLKDNFDQYQSFEVKKGNMDDVFLNLTMQEGHLYE